MFDPKKDFGSSWTAGGHIRSLRVERTAQAVAKLLEERGERMTFVGHDSRCRMNHYKGGVRAQIPKTTAGAMCRQIWLERYFSGWDEVNVIVQKAASSGTWVKVAEQVCQSMAAREDMTDAVKWSVSHLEAGEGFIERTAVVSAFINENPGPLAVRARELSAALRHLNLADISTNPRCRIGGKITPIIPGVRWKQQQQLSIAASRTEDNFL